MSQTDTGELPLSYYLFYICVKQPEKTFANFYLYYMGSIMTKMKHKEETKSFATEE